MSELRVMMMMEWNGEEMELINLLYEIFVNTKQNLYKGNHYNIGFRKCILREPIHLFVGLVDLRRI